MYIILEVGFNSILQVTHTHTLTFKSCTVLVQFEGLVNLIKQL